MHDTELERRVHAPILLAEADGGFRIGHQVHWSAQALTLCSSSGLENVRLRTERGSTADFVKQVAISDMFEIESSKVAQQKADDATKKFAAQMVKDHTKTSSELKSILQGEKPELPGALDSSHQSKLDKLKGLSGTDFTKEYRSIQVSAHKDAVSLFERYANGGDNEKLKTWAANAPRPQAPSADGGDAIQSSVVKR